MKTNIFDNPEKKTPATRYNIHNIIIKKTIPRTGETVLFKIHTNADNIITVYNVTGLPLR